MASEEHAVLILVFNLFITRVLQVEIHRDFYKPDGVEIFLIIAIILSAIWVYMI